MQDDPEHLNISYRRAAVVAAALALFAAVLWGATLLEQSRLGQAQNQAEARLAAIAGERAVRRGRDEIAQLKGLIEESQKRAGETATDFAKRLEEERGMRLEAERAQEQVRRDAAGKIAELEKNVAESKQSDLTALVQKWRLRVAHIECSWAFSDGRTFRANGSGFFFGTDLIATNRHVVEANGVVSPRCEVALPDDPQTLVLVNLSEPGRIAFDQEDFALINVRTPTDYVRRLTAEEQAGRSPAILTCKARASSGDQLIILGYPTIGSQTDVTVTDGIISGYEDPYYITSAKLERGNSGGAAVLVKNDCYLGIPTFVRAGGLESLGRILDFSKVIKR